MKPNFLQMLGSAKLCIKEEDVKQDEEEEEVKKEEKHSRAVLIAAVKDEEGVGFAKEILLVQLIPAELHHD